MTQKTCFAVKNGIHKYVLLIVLQFLGEISNRSVSPMKDESSMLLKRYFVASRRVRQQTMSAKGGAEIHVSAIETMLVDGNTDSIPTYSLG